MWERERLWQKFRKESSSESQANLKIFLRVNCRTSNSISRQVRKVREVLFMKGAAANRTKPRNVTQNGRARAGARPRIRLCDESPDGDLALPCPRRARASPGVASTASPTLRVHRGAGHECGLRRSRMFTNRCESRCAIQRQENRVRQFRNPRNNGSRAESESAKRSRGVSLNPFPLACSGRAHTQGAPYCRVSARPESEPYQVLNLPHSCSPEGAHS